MIRKIIAEETEAFLKEYEATEEEAVVAKIAFREGMNRAFARIFEESLHGDIKFCVHVEGVHV